MNQPKSKTCHELVSSFTIEIFWQFFRRHSAIFQQYLSDIWNSVWKQPKRLANHRDLKGTFLAVNRSQLNDICMIVHFKFSNSFSFCDQEDPAMHEVWAGVHDLPDMKLSFPKWRPRGYENFPRLKEIFGLAGMDLIQQLLHYDPKMRLSGLRTRLNIIE